MDWQSERDKLLAETLAFVEGVNAASPPLVPSGFKAQTGGDFLDDQRAQAGSFGTFLKIALQGFAPDFFPKNSDSGR